MDKRRQQSEFFADVTLAEALAAADAAGVTVPDRSGFLVGSRLDIEGSVAEITALGKAVIFIPFPYAADNHQVLNAAGLSNEGAAELIIEKDLSGKILSEKIMHYAAQPAALKEMAVKAKNFGKPDAAGNIVDDCYRLLAA